MTARGARRDQLRGWSELSLRQIFEALQELSGLPADKGKLPADE